MRYFVFTCFIFLVPFLGFSQSISELQKQKENAAKEIEYTTRLLQEAQKNEKSSLTKLNLLNSKIRQRNNLIAAINGEIRLYDEFISNNIISIDLLGDDLKKLKDEYAEMIRLAYKNRHSGDVLLFMLSADNFNQAYRRLLYTRRYSDYRQNQVETISSVQEVLNESIKKLEERKAAKQQLVGQTQQERQQLSKEQGQQNQELQQLKDQKRSLEKRLQEQRKIEEQLEREIQRIIEEEAKKGRDAGVSGFALTPEQKLIGDNFEQNKLRLPWPVERGIIVEHFGIHQHPVLTNVQVRNNGVNIATEAGSKVRAVFNGEVTRVFGISGGNTAVIIRHGSYLSVYSNLREVVVKKGDKVTTKQVIGTVFTDYNDDNKTILKFQIWHESQKMNPEDWIVR
ncbi:peptidoglycan DD-metalloendopeptidase family protein [Maribellus sp. YY47]|uniref:murein hydrolase activator EnvC family protein n=1 Tax=Maribellus sp. YY47 TaxID=2929486 RepID=UPI0020016C09|nr:peptidoglycan DD-metalloendopeptidase family protein [Maribellus sp. YY47]MCK3686114.1 peptidoglycan DD-metalloendopeptidase family protein [Maribellus sp. YY47]